MSIVIAHPDSISRNLYRKIFEVNGAEIAGVYRDLKELLLNGISNQNIEPVRLIVTNFWTSYYDEKYEVYAETKKKYPASRIVIFSSSIGEHNREKLATLGISCFDTPITKYIIKKIVREYL